MKLSWAALTPVGLIVAYLLGNITAPWIPDYSDGQWSTTAESCTEKSDGGPGFFYNASKTVNLKVKSGAFVRKKLIIAFRTHLESEYTENVTAEFGDKRAYSEVLHKATDPQVTIDAGTLSPFQELTVTLTVRQGPNERGGKGTCVPMSPALSANLGDTQIPLKHLLARAIVPRPENKGAGQ